MKYLAAELRELLQQSGWLLLMGQVATVLQHSNLQAEHVVLIVDH